MPQGVFWSFPNIVVPGVYSGVVGVLDGESFAGITVHVVFSKEQAADCVKRKLEDERQKALLIQCAAASKLPVCSRIDPRHVDGFPALYMGKLVQMSAEIPDSALMAMELGERPVALVLSTEASVAFMGGGVGQHGFAILSTTTSGAEMHLGYSRAQALELLYSRTRFDAWAACYESMAEQVVTSALPEISPKSAVTVVGSTALNLLRTSILCHRRREAAAANIN